MANRRTQRKIAPSVTVGEGFAARNAIAEVLADRVMAKNTGERKWAILENLDLVQALATIDRSLGVR